MTTTETDPDPTLCRRPEQGGATVAARLARGPRAEMAMGSVLSRAFNRWALAEEETTTTAARCARLLGAMPSTTAPVELLITLRADAVRVEVASGTDRAAFDVLIPAMALY